MNHYICNIMASVISTTLCPSSTSTRSSLITTPLKSYRTYSRCQSCALLIFLIIASKILGDWTIWLPCIRLISAIISLSQFNKNKLHPWLNSTSSNLHKINFLLMSPWNQLSPYQSLSLVWTLVEIKILLTMSYSIVNFCLKCLWSLSYPCKTRLLPDK